MQLLRKKWANIKLQGLNEMRGMGVALSQAQGRWSIDGNVLYSIATKGTQHTDLSDRFHYNGAVTYGLKGGDALLAHKFPIHHSHQGQSRHRGLELNGDWQAKQTISSATGGNVVFL